jgi:iron complex outermembrane receptor protein
MLLQQHFANAIDTQSKVLTLLLATKLHRNGLTLKLIYLELSQTQKVGAINASPILEANGQVNKYYSETSRI